MWLSRVLCSGFPEIAITVSAGLHFHLKGQPWITTFWPHSACWQISLPCGCKTQGPILSGPLPRGPPQDSSDFIKSGFPSSSAGKESTCNAGDPGSIRGSGRSSGEGISYPLQYSWASQLAQLVKNLLQCRIPGFNPGLGRSPRKGNSSILAWRIPWTI